MNFDNADALGQIFYALFQPYMERVPDVKKISQAMVAQGMIQDEKDIVNDHIAFRTLGIPHLGIGSFEKIFLHYGYKKREHYFFEQKRLDAWWYEPPVPSGKASAQAYPRIFISELRVGDLSQHTQEIIAKYTSGISSDPVDAIDLDDPSEVGQFFYRPLWGLPHKGDYQALLKESEYAAWVIYNRYYLNHYTISVHDLPDGYNHLEAFNTFLESIGVVLNTSGGKIKTSADGLLKQSSSVAKMISATFVDGEQMEIAGSYVEFAERRVLPQYHGLPKTQIQRQHRRDGFESGNADKIFESTYLEQVKK